MQRGFKHLVGAAADLKLDVPDAAAQIATFIARAVIDDVLPPSFVEDLSAGEPQLGSHCGALSQSSTPHECCRSGSSRICSDSPFAANCERTRLPLVT